MAVINTIELEGISDKSWGHAARGNAARKNPRSGLEAFSPGGIASSVTRASRGCQRGGPVLSVGKLTHYWRVRSHQPRGYSMR